MPLVISDSSTLIHLTAIGRLALLREFYEKITVPPAVWREVVEEGRGRAGAVEIEAARQPGGTKMTMRVLITGVNGLAGSQPAEYILAKRPPLHGMDPSTGSGYRLEGAVNIGCPQFVTVDELGCWYELAGGEAPIMPWPDDGLLNGLANPCVKLKGVAFWSTI